MAALPLLLVAASAACGSCSRAAAKESYGATLYRRDCSTCHGLDGRGRHAACPPLAGHAPALVSVPGGREYLVRVPLFGVAGAIEVAGMRYDGTMTSLDFRRDAELAAILNHVLTAWGNDRLLPPLHRPMGEGEIAAARREQRSAAQVRSLRPAVVLCSVGIGGWRD